jgi:hypothetical protein
MVFLRATTGLNLKVIDDVILSMLVFSTIILKIVASIGLKGYAVLFQKKSKSATVNPDEF